MLSPKSLDAPLDNVQEVAAQAVGDEVYLQTETLLPPPKATYPVEDEYVAEMEGLDVRLDKVNGADNETVPLQRIL